MNLKAQEASVQSLRETSDGRAGRLEFSDGSHQPGDSCAKYRRIDALRQVDNAVAQLKQAEVRLGYTKILRTGHRDGAGACGS